jgi:hypothetical protein
MDYELACGMTPLCEQYAAGADFNQVASPQRCSHLALALLRWKDSDADKAA